MAFAPVASADEAPAETGSTPPPNVAVPAPANPSPPVTLMAAAPACAETWVNGKPRPLNDVKCTFAPPEAGSCAARVGRPRSVTITATLPEGFVEDEIIRVDVQLPGYEDAHSFVRVHHPIVGYGTAGGEIRQPVPIHVTLARQANLRLRLRGATAAATGYAWIRVDGRDEQVDQCRVDVEAGVPSCDMYVPMASDGTVEATLNVVGTLNTSVSITRWVESKPGALAEIDLEAPRMRFNAWTVGGVAATIAVGVGLGAAFAGSLGEPKNEVGWEIGGALSSAAAFGTAYVWMVLQTSTNADVQPRYVRPDGTEIAPDKRPPSFIVPAYSSLSPGLRDAPRVTVGSAPLGFVLRW